MCKRIIVNSFSIARFIILQWKPNKKTILRTWFFVYVFTLSVSRVIVSTHGVITRVTLTIMAHNTLLLTAVLSLPAVLVTVQ